MARGAYSVGTAMIRREPCVVKGCTQPRCSVVTYCACCRKARCNVIGVGRRVVLRRMTRVTICRRPHIHVVDVAQIAGHRHMCPCQRERSVVVIEGRRTPRRRRVAHIARCRYPRARMWRIVSAVVILGMASVAIRRQRCVVVIHMAA